jgi:hypothetical protein
MISSRTLPELGTAPSAGEPPAHAPLSEDRAAARRRWLAAGALSVLINVVLVLAILVTLPPPPILVPKPIPVRIVPPSAIAKPLPKPKPPRQEHRTARRSQPKPPPTPPARPPGRLASVEMGDPKAPASAKLGSESPAAGAARREEGSEQPDDKGDATHTAAAKPTQTASLGAAKPNPAKVPKPSRRHGGAKVSALLTPPQAMRHHAAYPGPDATEDAYFAYLKELIEGYVTQKLVDDRLAVAHAPTVEIAVRGNGVILWAQITQSSGSKTVDRDYLDLFDRVGRFPPLPRYLTLNDGGWTTVTYGDASDSR